MTSLTVEKALLCVGLDAGSISAIQQTLRGHQINVVPAFSLSQAADLSRRLDLF